MEKLWKATESFIFPQSYSLRNASVPVAQWQSIALAAQKVVGSIPRKHTY